MPSNNASKLASQLGKGFDLAKEATTPVSGEGWERYVNKKSLKAGRQSDAFKIPKTRRQEPSTVLPNPPYEVVGITYAESWKAKPRQSRAPVRTNNGIIIMARQCVVRLMSISSIIKRPHTSPYKKAHRHWLHDAAIPDMDCEIMKTDELVDSVLAEQSKLDT